MNDLCTRADAVIMELTDNLFDTASLIEELEELKDSYVHIFLSGEDMDDREEVLNHFDLLSQLVDSMKRSLRKSHG